MNKKHFFKKIEENPEDKYEILSDYLAQSNKIKYNFNKLSEELQELSLLCLQFSNKVEERRPELERFIEEAGDVLMRMDPFIKVLAKYYETSPEDILLAISARRTAKMDNIITYIKENKYKGGI